MLNRITPKVSPSPKIAFHFGFSLLFNEMIPVIIAPIKEAIAAIKHDTALPSEFPSKAKKTEQISRGNQTNPINRDRFPNFGVSFVAESTVAILSSTFSIDVMFFDIGKEAKVVVSPKIPNNNVSNIFLIIFSNNYFYPSINILLRSNPFLPISIAISIATNIRHPNNANLNCPFFFLEIS